MGEDVVAELSRAMERQGLDMKVTALVSKFLVHDSVKIIYHLKLSHACYCYMLMGKYIGIPMKMLTLEFFNVL